MTPQSKNSRSVAGRLLISLLILALAFSIFVYRQRIIDQFNVWQFQPSQDVTAIAERATFTDNARFYFYASRPSVQDRTQFNQSCTTMRSETTVVLGCYVMQRIYLFNVSDEKLDGIKEVTAAHEMLHAAYDRLSQQNRARIDNLLEREAQKITDPAFVALVKEYEASEPGEKLNELHSLIGTQIKDIDPELEAYYRAYFTNRAQLVDLYEKYETVFTSVKAQQESIVAELDTLVEQINAATNDYNEGVARLDRDITSFNNQAENGGFSSQSEFESKRNALIVRQRQLGQDRTLIDGYIATYNAKRQQLSVINDQAEALNRSINSNLTPLPSI